MKQTRERELGCTSKHMTTITANESEALPKYVCLKRVAALVDAHRSSVRRWLTEAGVQPVAFGSGKKGAIRYRGNDVQAWLDGLKEVE